MTPMTRPGPGHCHVEPALTTLLVQRTESVQHLALRVLAVPDRDQDGVALVSLNAFEVLDEELLVVVEHVVEVLVELRVLLAGPAQFLVDALHVRDAHRDHAETLLRSLMRVLGHGAHHRLDFVGHRGLLADAARHEGDEFVGDDLVGLGPREGGERPVVEQGLRVREGDQPSRRVIGSAS